MRQLQSLEHTTIQELRAEIHESQARKYATRARSAKDGELSDRLKSALEFAKARQIRQAVCYTSPGIYWGGSKG